MELAAGTQVDRYVVEGPLGEGGMSVVYRVRHTTLGSLHALKVLSVSTPGLRQRLLLEGQVQASLRHPNIVPVTDVTDVGGALGLVMEHVEGPDLDATLRACPLSWDQIDALARDIVGVVAAAHAKGLVHRDLKPANILLMVVDDRLVPKITDCGLAKVLASPTGDSAHTRTGAMMGTPFYMAPEQVRDAKHVGPEADVFSLGAICTRWWAGSARSPAPTCSRCSRRSRRGGTCRSASGSPTSRRAWSGRSPPRSGSIWPIGAATAASCSHCGTARGRPAARRARGAPRCSGARPAW